MNNYEIETVKLDFINIESGIRKKFTVSEMLYEINRARSRVWKDITLAEWRQGMEQFTEWRLIK